MPIQCVILAGGRGSRMAPLTRKLPKALLPVRGRPFLHYLLGRLSRQGVTQVVLSIGYKGEMIRAYAQDGSRWGLKIRYVVEREGLRGTAGALRLALEAGALAPSFLVTYGDAFLPIDISKVWRFFLGRREPALMTVLKNEGKWDRSNVCLKGDKVILYDKRLTKNKPKEMRFIDYGFSAFRRSLIEKEVPPGKRCDLAELFKRLSLRGDLAGYEVKTRFYEIGSPAGMADFTRYLQKTGRRR